MLYRCPTIHIIPYTSNNLAYGTSNIIKSMLKLDKFKGNILIHSLCKKYSKYLIIFIQDLFLSFLFCSLGYLIFLVNMIIYSNVAILLLYVVVINY